MNRATIRWYIETVIGLVFMGAVLYGTVQYFSWMPLTYGGRWFLVPELDMVFIRLAFWSSRIVMQPVIWIGVAAWTLSVRKKKKGDLNE